MPEKRRADGSFCPFDNIEGSDCHCIQETCALWMGHCAILDIALSLASISARDEHRLQNEAAACQGA